MEGTVAVITEHLPLNKDKGYKVTNERQLYENAK